MNQATRLSPATVMAMVESKSFTLTPSGKAIVCEIVLNTGWTCHGVARVIDLENFDEQRGKEAAESKAMVEVFDYAAVRMQEAIHSGKVLSRNKELMAEHLVANNNQPKAI